MRVELLNYQQMHLLNYLQLNKERYIYTGTNKANVNMKSQYDVDRKGKGLFLPLLYQVFVLLFRISEGNK